MGKPSETLRLRHPVPARPSLALLAPATRASVDESSCRESDERFVSAVQTANRRCSHKRRSPTSVVLPPVRSLSSVGLVGLSDPTSVSSGDWWVVLGLNLLRSWRSVIGGWICDFAVVDHRHVGSPLAVNRLESGLSSPPLRVPVGGSAEVGPTRPQSPQATGG